MQPTVTVHGYRFHDGTLEWVTMELPVGCLYWTQNAQREFVIAEALPTVTGP